MSGTTSASRLRKLQCPKCGSSHIAEIIRGMPAMDAQLEKQITAGEVVLGGCVIMGNDPEHHCNGCGYQWRTWPPDALE